MARQKAFDLIINDAIWHTGTHVRYTVREIREDDFWIIPLSTAGMRNAIRKRADRAGQWIKKADYISGKAHLRKTGAFPVKTYYIEPSAPASASTAHEKGAKKMLAEEDKAIKERGKELMSSAEHTGSQRLVIPSPREEEDSPMRQMGLRIKATRQALSMVQEAVATACELSKNGFGQIERGCASPSVWTLVRIARVLHTTPNDLLGIASKAAAPEAPAETPKPRPRHVGYPPQGKLRDWRAKYGEAQESRLQMARELDIAKTAIEALKQEQADASKSVPIKDLVSEFQAIVERSTRACAALERENSELRDRQARAEKRLLAMFYAPSDREYPLPVKGGAA
jgi:DNA-binding XRE family transcriptional regulator